MDIGSLFSRKSAPMLGLDISSSSLKLVELGQDRSGNLVLERCGIEPLERGWISEGNIEKFDEVVDAMRRLVSKTGTKTKHVAMALPASVVISKRVVLPSGLSERELEIQVESEANQYIPFSLDEVSLDFCVVGPSATSAGDVDVVIAASRKEKVEDRQGLAESVGLTPVVIDVESYASRLAAGRVIERLPGGGVDAMIALFEIGAMNSTLQVIRNDDLVYERDQVFGGAQLTQMIARHRLKIAATVENAKRFLAVQDEFGSFDAFIWSFVGGKPLNNKRVSSADIPTSSDESAAMSKSLKKRGFKFVGATTCYAYMQAVGMVNDHLTSCFRYKEVKRLQKTA